MTKKTKYRNAVLIVFSLIFYAWGEPVYVILMMFSIVFNYFAGIQIGDYKFTATLEKTAAANELFQMLEDAPLVLELDDYSGFEKVGPLGKSLTRSDKQTTTQKGDIVLYNGSNIVMFYGSNSWSYTRLGKIDDLTNWEEALGSGSVTVTLRLL